MTIECVGKGPR